MRQGSPSPPAPRRGQLGLREVGRHSNDSQLLAARVPLSPQFWRGSAHLVKRRSSAAGGTKSPGGSQECGEVGGVTAQKFRHQVAHQCLQSASLDAPNHEGLIPVPRGHTFPLGWNTAETRVRGGTKDARKAGAGAQTESPVIPRIIGKFGLVVQNEAGPRLTEFCQENMLVIENTL